MSLGNVDGVSRVRYERIRLMESWYYYITIYTQKTKMNKI